MLRIHAVHSVVTLLLMSSLLVTLVPLITTAQTLTPATEQPLTAAFTTSLSCTNTSALRGIPTYESIGLYLSAGGGEAKVRYRTGSGAWKEGFSLYYDARNNSLITQNSNGARQRGSIVHLSPNTQYEVQVLHGDRLYCANIRTKNDNFPIAKTVNLGNRSGVVTITEGGSPNGYVLYTGGTITGGNQYNIVVDADYVIIRGMKLVGGARGGININPGHNNIVIENNEITGFGAIAPDAGREGPESRYWGLPFSAGHAGINAEDKNHSLTIQRNYIHTPRSDSNTWGEFREFSGATNSNCVTRAQSRCHPFGPSAIFFWHGPTTQKGQNVIRYNTMVGTPTHMFEDVAGGRNNDQEYHGFPGPDSDLYGNYMAGFTDDGIEAEGIGRNARIWGNHIHNFFGDGNPPQASTGASIALSPVTVGPLYIWRNLMTNAPGAAKVFTIKKQASSVEDSGALFYFHNTVVGNGSGIRSSVTKIRGVFAYNNVMRVSNNAFEGGGENYRYDYNIYTSGSPSQPNGLQTTPQLDGNNILRAGTAGVNAGVPIPNFNDNYAGSGPDMGYQEAGGQPLRVGHTGSPIQVTGGGTGATGDVTIPGDTTGTTPTIPLDATPCGDYESPTTPAGYGSAFNHFSSEREMIVEAGCTQLGFTPAAGSYLTTQQNFAVYTQGYYWTGTAWRPFTFTPTTGLSRLSTNSNAWILGNGITNQIPYVGPTTYFVAYTCHFGPGQTPKCGCSDSTCATPKWQVQKVTRPAPGSNNTPIAGAPMRRTAPLLTVDFNQSALGVYTRNAIQTDWNNSHGTTNSFQVTDKLQIVNDNGNKVLRKEYPANTCCALTNTSNRVLNHRDAFDWRFNQSVNEATFLIE